MRLLMIAAVITTAALGADDKTATKIFSDNVNDYVKIQKTAAGKVPAIGKQATPEEIDQRQKALVEAIRSARPTAKQGDVFIPEVQPLFTALLRKHLAGPQNKDSRAVAKQGNPKHDAQPDEAQPVIQVNAVYPKSAPLSSVPPFLLMELPKLPMNVEYRFVGKTLVLYDSLSNLIIDYIKEAAPGL